MNEQGVGITREFVQEALVGYVAKKLDPRHMQVETSKLWKEASAAPFMMRVNRSVSLGMLEALLAGKSERIVDKIQAHNMLYFHLGYLLGIAVGRRDAEVERLEGMDKEARDV